MPDDKKHEDEPPLDSKALQQRILSGVKSDTGEKTGKWVLNLKDGISDKVEVPTQFDEARAAQLPDEMPSWIDKLFDEFQRYQFEFNKSQSNQDLIVDSERPTFTRSSTATGSIKYQPQQGTQYFQGHLHTKKYALLVRGAALEIKAWTIPIDVLIGFDTKEAAYQPYLEMRGAKNKRGLIIWHLDALPLSYEALNAVAKTLFSALIKAAKGELESGEKLTLAAAAKEVATDTAQFMQRYTIPPGTPGFAALLKPEDLERPQAAPQKAPAQQAYPPPAMPGTGYPPPGYSTPGASAGYAFPQQQHAPRPYPPAPAQPSAPGYQQAPLPPQSGPPSGVPPAAPAPAWHYQQAQTQPAGPVGQQPAANATQPPEQTAKSQPTGPNANSAVGPPNNDLLNKALDENLRQLMLSCQSQAQTVFTQLDILSRIGIAAMQVQNMEVVNTIMLRTKALKAFKDQMDNFVREINSTYPPK